MFLCLNPDKPLNWWMKYSKSFRGSHFSINMNSGLTRLPVSVDMKWIYSAGGISMDHITLPSPLMCTHTWDMSVFTHASRCLFSWSHLVILHTHALLTCSMRKGSLCWFSIGIPKCVCEWESVCVCVWTCVCNMHLQNMSGCSCCLFNSSCCLMRTYITQATFLYMGEFHCLQLHQWAVSKFWGHRSKSVLIGWLFLWRKMSVWSWPHYNF